MRSAALLLALSVAACRSPQRGAPPDHVQHPVVDPAPDPSARPDPPAPACATPLPESATMTVALPNGVELALARIPGGETRIGSEPSERGRWPDENPHRVRLDTYFMGIHPVTQRQWSAVLGAEPPSPSACGPDCPVSGVSWDDCQAFVQRLNLTVGCGFALPSEAQWEHACRLGAEPSPPLLQPESDVSVATRVGKRLSPVGRGPANAVGLHELHGAVWQWCENRYAPEVADLDVVQPGLPLGRNRAMRGGSYSDNDRSMRCSARDSDAPDVRLPIYGCRVVRRGR